MCRSLDCRWPRCGDCPWPAYVRPADAEVLEACRREQRCLITLDLDFSNPLRFPPANTSGIAVVRLPGRASHPDLLNAVTTLAKALETESIDGKLWIVEVGRVRIYRPEDE